MNSRKYKQLVDTYTPKENRLTNMLVSFLSGGVIGLIGTFLFIRLNNIYNEDLSVAFTLLILIATISFITAIGKADNLFETLMGASADKRKKYIEENSERAIIYV
jgi:hypothetical protein